MSRPRMSLCSIGALAAVLLPLAASGESSLEFEAQRSVRARLSFTIVIPQTLSVELGESLSVGDAGRHVASFALNGAEVERHRMILSGAGHRSIARFADCSRSAFLVHCTVSMP